MRSLEHEDTFRSGREAHAPPTANGGTPNCAFAHLPDTQTAPEPFSADAWSADSGRTDRMARGPGDCVVFAGRWAVDNPVVDDSG
ncbi:hypothetical protein CS378_20745 [Rhodococcus ruber]|nr:hypothetical protein CS378_20745 [Rhodococcus ruber]AUM16516.1 hypothetical protein CSW53_08245 [Rhodococcus ruber]AXY50694.1 hypothetical protein YT1_1251 [Rhodococcus ruber]RIK14088.1 MAG: hypothetical protein DCC47_00925 [Acidobacteriota bacterium]RQM34807.1 hypothetical protein TN91_07365 [Rhodococcus ruber]